MIEIILVLIGIIVGWRLASGRRKRRFLDADISNPENQARFISAVRLRPAPPINREAYKAVFRLAEKTIRRTRKPYRLLAEVSLGSFIKTDFNAADKIANDRAFSSYNSKRIDFLIIDPVGMPALAIEYHGSGHFQGNAEARDAVKALALSHAGIPLLTVYEGDGEDEIEGNILDGLGLADPEDAKGR